MEIYKSKVHNIAGNDKEKIICNIEFILSKGRFKNDVTAKNENEIFWPPLSPFVIIFGLPPPSHDTGENGDKLSTSKWLEKNL